MQKKANLLFFTAFLRSKQLSNWKGRHADLSRLAVPPLAVLSPVRQPAARTIVERAGLPAYLLGGGAPEAAGQAEPR